MISDPRQLPTDTPTLHKIIVKLLAENESLKDALIRMRHARFGASSEKLNDQQIQLFADMFAGELTLPVDPTTDEDSRDQESGSVAGSEPPKRKPRRKRLPPHLRRVETHLDLTAEEKICPCCQGALHHVGTDCAEKLGYIPPEYWVDVIIRHKYACRACEDAVYQKPLPLTSNPKGLFAESLQAQIVVSKYTDHQPLHRQHRILQRSGIELPVSTLSDNCAQVAGQLKPLVELLRRKMLQSTRVFTDDTILPRNNSPDSPMGRVNQSRIWIYLGGERDGPVSAYYHYTPDRRARGPQGVLADYEGFLQADAYPGYKKLYRKQGHGDEAVIVEVACMAHVRRKFKEATLGLPAESTGLAYEALLLIKQLYTIERQIKTCSDAERRAARQDRAKPVMAEFRHWLDRTVHQVGRKSDLYRAIHYALNQWSGLQTYLDYGFLEIDNNTAERSMKPIALGRKNYLFVGSDKGGETAAILYSILETCRLNQVEPLAYLTDVLTRLPVTPATELESLLPYHWQSHQQAKTEAA
jgi:transposase